MNGLLGKAASVGILLLAGGLAAAPGPLSAAAQTPANGVLESIRVESSAETVEISIGVHGFTSHVLRVFEGRPNQIVIDFKGVGSVVSASRVPVGKAGVTAVRTGQFETATARLVVDLAGGLIPYELTENLYGFRLRLGDLSAPKPETPPEKPPEKKAEEPPVKPPPKPEVKAEAKVETKTELVPPVKIEEPLTVKRVEKEEVEKAEEAKEEPKAELPVVSPEDAARILAEMNAERERLSFKRFRLGVEMSSFNPQGGILKTDYGGGLSAGLSAGYAITRTIEAWFSASRYGKTASPEGGARTASLVPLAAGLGVRFVRGAVNPYAGLGLGPFFFREESPEATVRATKIGLTGRAGVYFRIGQTLILDVFGRLQTSSVEVGGKKIDLGGIHFGIGLGGEF